MRHAAWILASVLLAVSPAQAESLFTDCQRLLKPSPEAIGAAREWLKTVIPDILDASFKDGRQIQFWSDALSKDLDNLTRAIERFQAEPSLFLMYEVTRKMYTVEHSFSELNRAFANCLSCSDKSMKRVEDWFVKSRPHYFAVQELRDDFVSTASFTALKADQLLSVRESNR